MNASIHQDTFSNIQINSFNAKGDSLSSEVISLPGHQQPNGVIHAKDSQLVIYGDENPSPHAANDTLGPSKAFLYLQDMATGITKVVEGSDVFKLYPNPAHQELSIDANPNQILPGTTLEIWSALGMPASTFPLEGTLTTIPLSDFHAGIYHYRILTPTANLQTGSFVIR